MSPLHGGGAFSGGHVIVFQDLTELRRLELDARRNERLASLGKLAAGLAHELRNPLASMSGAVQMLTSHRNEDPDEQRLGDIVVSESERLNRLVSDFLGFARPNPSRPVRLRSRRSRLARRWTSWPTGQSSRAWCWSARSSRWR